LPTLSHSAASIVDRIAPFAPEPFERPRVRAQWLTGTDLDLLKRIGFLESRMMEVRALYRRTAGSFAGETRPPARVSAEIISKPAPNLGRRPTVRADAISFPNPPCAQRTRARRGAT
jgi:hypothetical protein